MGNEEKKYKKDLEQVYTILDMCVEDGLRQRDIAERTDVNATFISKLRREDNVDTFSKSRAENLKKIIDSSKELEGCKRKGRLELLDRNLRKGLAMVFNKTRHCPTSLARHVGFESSGPISSLQKGENIHDASRDKIHRGIIEIMRDQIINKIGEEGTPIQEVAAPGSPSKEALDWIAQNPCKPPKTEDDPVDLVEENIGEETDPSAVDEKTYEKTTDYKEALPLPVDIFDLMDVETLDKVCKYCRYHRVLLIDYMKDAISSYNKVKLNEFKKKVDIDIFAGLK